MSRLTRRVRSDVSPMVLKMLNLEEAPEECIEVVGTDSKTCDEVCKENQCKYCVLSAVFEKLAHYEDLEEQGRLIEQKHGHWIKSRKYYDDGYTVIGACSVCGLEFQAKLLRKICYCPHCGAKMDEVKE